MINTFVANGPQVLEGARNLQMAGLRAARSVGLDPIQTETGLVIEGATGKARDTELGM